jgi:hypothetical protein
MSLIFKTEGFEELNDQLIALAKDIRSADEFKGFKKILSMSTRKALNPLADDMRARAPYDGDRPANKADQPHLRNTVRVDTRIPTTKDRQSIMVNESDAYIGIVSVKKSAVSLSQEFGNARTSAHPYLRITAESGREQATNILKSELSQRIPAYIKSLSKSRAK